MPALLILAHAPLAGALKQAALHTYAEDAQRIQAVDVPPQADAQAVQSLVCEALERARASTVGHEVLVMTDVFGATPCNMATRLAQEPGVRVVAGVNVPMLWRVLNYAQEPLDQLVSRALGGAAQGILQVTATASPQQQTTIHANAEVDHHHHQ